ncbi:hypothetical protein RHMOL_Rhmol01G0114800 [Rhododendron molle]|uniref:Uncharacterized protein n=1 Tax=Rhododendron molle TaxID=49168 RepID=A0ACC0Q3M7_RHOML|nr:hypothetical protein RHMOL_Rhmol01G0114800 [Rhododendron molle]
MLQMSELLNWKSSIQGKFASGYLNAIFDLSGSWLIEAADAENLAFDGYFISASPLVLQDTVKKSVPSHWNLASLSGSICHEDAFPFIYQLPKNVPIQQNLTITVQPPQVGRRSWLDIEKTMSRQRCLDASATMLLGQKNASEKIF